MRLEHKKLNCNTVAVLSDIHSNYYALKACIADAIKCGAKGFVFLGDYVSGLANPQETLDLIYEIRAQYATVCIGGNRERYMLNHKNGVSVLSRGLHTASYLYTYEKLREKDFIFIESLPIFDKVKIGGLWMEIAHATKYEDRYYFEKNHSGIQTVFEQMETDYFLTGHSHRQYTQTTNRRTIINPGSVGLPKGEDGRAQYAILDTSQKDSCCSMRKVAYDYEMMIHAQFDSGLVENAKYWAIGDLYNALTGEEYTKMLLSKVYQYEKEHGDREANEKMWRQFALELGMKLTKNEILEMISNKHIDIF